MKFYFYFSEDVFENYLEKRNLYDGIYLKFFFEVDVLIESGFLEMLMLVLSDDVFFDFILNLDLVS